MRGSFFSLAGIHYRNPSVYNGLDLLKRGKRRDLRFKIAASYLKGASSVLDLCGGLGRLKSFLPETSSYVICDASRSFIHSGASVTATRIHWNLHHGLPAVSPFDAVSLVISLCHFKNTSMESLLESMKRCAPRVVIVEEVRRSDRAEGPLRTWVRNTLCAEDYYVPMELFTAEEFESALKRHGYEVIHYDNQYSVGLYNSCR